MWDSVPTTEDSTASEARGEGRPLGGVVFWSSINVGLLSQMGLLCVSGSAGVCGSADCGGVDDEWSKWSAGL